MRTCAQETFASARPAIEALMIAQWAETGDPRLPLAPNWQFYALMEKVNKLVILVVRENGKAIGYAGGALHPHPNSMMTQIATIPTWYVEPMKGRVFVEKALLQELAKRLFERGAKRVKIETNANHSAGKLLEAMGYHVASVGFELEAGEAKREAVHA